MASKRVFPFSDGSKNLILSMLPSFLPHQQFVSQSQDDPGMPLDEHEKRPSPH